MRDHILTAKNTLMLDRSSAAVVETLGMYADEATWVSAASIEAIAAASRVSVKTVGRVFAALSGDAHDGLLQVLRAPKGGPGAVWVVRVHWERLIAVAKSVARSRKAIMGGTVRALAKRKLLECAASAGNCADVIGALQAAVLTEGQHGASRDLAVQMGLLTDAMADWPGKVLVDADSEVDRACGQSLSNAAFLDANLDMVSANLDTVSAAHSIDNFPTGVSSYGEPVDKLDFKLASLAALVEPNRKQRIALMETLIGCQLASFDGHLMIRTGSRDQHDTLTEKHGMALFSAALDQGFYGCLITVREPDQPEHSNPKNESEVS